MKIHRSKRKGLLVTMVVLGVLVLTSLVFAGEAIRRFSHQHLGSLVERLERRKEILTEPSIPSQKEITPWEKERKEAVAKKALNPNIKGKIPIIMYHQIGDHEEEWMRSRENFLKDLRRFYELGYTLIPMQDYLSGKINLPKGESPIILTFDDGTKGQLEIDKGLASPNSAVGMLLNFEKDHPGFGHAATFYVNFPSPFGTSREVQDKLRFLLDHGMEIGNHTYNHRNLAHSSTETIRKELSMQAKAVYELTGQSPKSLALPYGGFPRDKKARAYLLAGEWAGFSYENKGVLLVGAEPAPSPFDDTFNPLAIPRIRGSSEELDKWLKYLDKPGVVYVSPGEN